MFEVVFLFFVVCFVGVFYLGMIVFGFFVELGLCGLFIVGSDVFVMVCVILVNGLLFCVGLVVDFVMLVCYVGVMMFFFDMFCFVYVGVLWMVVVFSLIGIVVLVVDMFLLLVLLWLLVMVFYFVVFGLL